MSRQSQLSYELIQLLGDPQNMEAILNIARDYLHNPIHLTDLTGKLLACSRGNSPVDPIWDGIEEKGYIDHETYQSTCRMNVQKIRGSLSPTLITNAPGSVNLIVCGLRTPSNFRANLIVLEKNQPFCEEDKNLLAITATSLSTILDECYPDSGPKIHASDYLICDLLDTPDIDSSSVAERSKIVSFYPRPPMQILTICHPGNIAAPSILNMVRSHLENLFHKCKTVVHHNRTVTILTENIFSSVTFPSCGIMPLLKKYGLTAAISIPFEDLAYIYPAYMQTVLALEYGSIIQPHQLFYHYEDYAVYRFIEELNIQGSFCHPCIRRLQEYDTKHKTDYTRTLYAYITHFCSMRDAATAIHVHYNTLKYRLGRIIQIIDLSLEDSGTFLMLYLSFKSMELTGTVFKGDDQHEKHIPVPGQ